MGFKLFPEDLKQWKVVVVSFLTAATFWFFNSLNKDYTTSLEYPIQFEYNSDSLIAVKKLPQNINLDVTGGGWNLLRRTAIFQPNPVSVDLSNFEGLASLSWLEMLPSIREQISDLNIKQVLNDTLNIQLEPIRKKWLKPSIDSLAVDLEEFYRITSPIQVQEDSILLIGPRSIIDTLVEQYLVETTKKEIDSDFDEFVKVMPSNENLLLASPSEINVRFEVEKFELFSIEIPIEKMNFPKDSSIVLTQEFVTIEFVVQESKQESYVSSDFVVMADYSMLRSSDSTVLAILSVYPMEALDVKILPEIIKVETNE